MKTLLDDILRVKKFHESAAEREVHLQQFRVEEAAKKVQEAEKAVKAYHEWRVKREDQLYNAVEKRQVRVQTLEDLKMKIGQLRMKELSLEEDARAAESERVAAVKELEEAKARHVTAVREKDKIRELVEKEALVLAKEAERREEAEMEEFSRRHVEGDEDDWAYG